MLITMLKIFLIAVILIIIYSFTKGKNKSISSILGKINFIISNLIFIPYIGFYIATWKFFYKQGRNFPKESGAEALPLALFTGIIGVVGTFLSIFIVIGIIISILDLISKKKYSVRGLLLNLLSGLYWTVFYFSIYFLK